MKKNLLKIVCFCIAIIATAGGVLGVIEQNTYTGLSSTDICQPERTNLEAGEFSFADQTNCKLLTGQIDTINNGFAKLETIVFFSFAATFVVLGCLGTKRK